ncbi:MAG: hypothetical protein AB7N61_02825 [Acidimicrobiia bacterium]
MFTTGSKLSFGAAGAFLVASVVYMITSKTGGEFAGFWTLMSAFFALTFLGLLLVGVRDANPSQAEREAWLAAETGGGPIAPRVSPSAWPIIAAFGVMVTALGLVLDSRVFLLGVVLMVVATLEWAVQGWSDRASDDPAYNKALRGKIMRPFEFPVFGIIIGAFVVLGFSRIILAADKTVSVAIFSAVAAAVFVVFVAISYAPKLGRTLVPVLLVLGGAGILTAGIVGAVQGERHFHEETAEDRDGTGTVSNKSGVAATITLQGNEFAVEVQGSGDSSIVLAKATTVNFLFRNTDSSKHNLVIEAEDGTVIATSNLVEQDQATVLTVRLNAPGKYRAVSEGGDVKAETVITVQ